MVNLRPYQEQILDELSNLASIGLFMGTGTGKTITSLFRSSQNPTKNLLIICPHSVLYQWADVINTHFKQYKVLDFKRTWSASQKNTHILQSTNYNVIIINFEIVSKISALKLILNDTWTIIVDESHRIKSVGTKKKPIVVTKSVLELRDKTPWKIILTATPSQAGYEDYYSQLYFLGYLDINYQQFLNRYCIVESMYVKTSPYPIKVITGYKNKEELDDILRLCCRKYQSKFGDYEPEHIKVMLERPKNYARVKRERIYGEIVLKNMARLRIGLKTLCTGSILGMDNYKESYVYDDNNIKDEWLVDFLTDTAETVAIYYNYNVELDRLKSIMERLKLPYIVVNGETKDKYSEINKKEFRVMLGQYQSASESLDGLQHKCHIMIMYAMPESSLLHKQSLGRIDRDGQTQVPMYYYLVMKDTIEEDIYNMVEQKIDFTEEILEKLLIEGE